MEKQPKGIPQKGFNPSFIGKENDKANAEKIGKGMSGMHMDNLYDMEEDVFGQKVNEATGKKIDNTKGGAPDESNFHSRIIDPSKEGDIMGAVENEEDEATKWLRANDKKH